LSRTTQIILISVLLLLGSVPYAPAQKSDSSPGSYKPQVRTDSVLIGVPLPPERQDHLQAPTVISKSIEELMATFPELRPLDADPDQNDLPSLLGKVGSGVQALFHDFPNTCSLEQVRLERMDSSGRVVEALNRKLQYLMIARPGQEELGIEEYRTDTRGRRVDLMKLQAAFLLTSGYASTPIFFHPFYQDESDFRYLGRETVEPRAHVLAFAQKPNVARLRGTFGLSGRPAHFLLQGLVWIHPADFHIARMHTELLHSLPEVELLMNSTVIEMEPVQFSQISRTLWLPHEVTVTTEWGGKFYRNRHRYSDYKLFTVETREERKSPVVP
jgi:hypothetical protein